MPSYSRGRSLGRGAYGDVYVVYDNDTYDEYAAKQFAWDDCGAVPLETIREVGVLKALQHPRIARLIEVVNNWRGYVMQIMPLYRGGSLARAVETKCLDYWQRLTVLMDLFEALRYLHDHRVVHRDVKCDNVVLDDDRRGVLVDFSFARLIGAPQGTTQRSERTAQSVEDGCTMVNLGNLGSLGDLGGLGGLGNPGNLGDHGHMTRNVGTTGYIAPEVLARRDYRESADAWSAGVVALEVTRNILLKPPRDKAAYRHLRAERRKLARRDTVSRVIKELLQDDPADRPGAHAALVELMAISPCLDRRQRCRARVPSLTHILEPIDCIRPDCQEDLEDELYKWIDDPGDVALALQCLRGLMGLQCAAHCAVQDLALFAIKLAGFAIDYSEEPHVDLDRQRDLELDILKATDWSVVFIASSVERQGKVDGAIQMRQW
jgi:serine/threonine protein kinase